MYKTENTVMKQTLTRLGYENLRPQQADPINSLLHGNDTFVSMSTGSGKSLIFQAPAIIQSNRLSLNFSPLKALQRDQVEQLQQKGIRAFLLNSDLSKTELNDVMQKAVLQGGLLYLAPEQLQNEKVKQTLMTANIAVIAIDEAHILAQTQDDFRKAYAGIGVFITGLPKRPPILAMTATATPEDRKTIMNSLGMKEANVFTYPVRRENLRLYIKLVEAEDIRNKRESLLMHRFHAVEQELQAWNGKGSCIIYCPTVRMVNQLFDWLRACDDRIGKYHGQMKHQKRKAAYEKFMLGKRPVMVATNAFGLGINKSDVRLLIHAGLPLSLDGYVQETGRAGRDGKKSRCVLFYANSDFADNERILRQGNEEVTHQKLRRLRALQDLVKSNKCLWKEIEKYFGQKKTEACGHCCNCKWKGVK